MFKKNLINMHSIKKITCFKKLYTAFYFSDCDEMKTTDITNNVSANNDTKILSTGYLRDGAVKAEWTFKIAEYYKIHCDTR